MRRRRPVRPDFSSPNPAWLSSRELAHLVGFRSAATVDRLAARYEDFPRCVRILHDRGNRRWRRAEVVSWMERHIPSLSQENAES